MRARENLTAALLALVVCAAWTWPLALEPLAASRSGSPRMPVGRVGGGAWMLWWWSEASAAGLDPMWSSLEMLPEGRPLTAEAIIPLTALPARPLVGAIGALAAADLLRLAQLWLGAWIAWVLARRIGLARGAAAVAAGAWALSPLSRELLATEPFLAAAPWTPLAALALAAWASAPDRRRACARAFWAGLAGGASVAASWSAGVPALVLLAVLVAWAPAWSGSPRAGGWLEWSAALAGLLLPALAVWPHVASLARWASLDSAPQFARLASHAAEPRRLAPVLIAALLLAGLACARERRARVLAMAAAPLLVMAAFPPLHGLLAEALPAGGWIPEPRAWGLAGILPLSLAAGAGFEHLGALRFAPLARAAAVGLLAAQAWPVPLPPRGSTAPAAVRAIAAHGRSGAVLTIPSTAGPGAEQAWQTVHGHPVALGRVECLPPRRLRAWIRRFPDLAALLWGEVEGLDPDLVCLDLEGLDVAHVLVDGAREPRSEAIAGLLDRMPRWQRGASGGEEVRWWHRSALAYGHGRGSVGVARSRD